MKNGMFEIVHVIHVFNGELHKWLIVFSSLW
jgi:hypothetical protein